MHKSCWTDACIQRERILLPKIFGRNSSDILLLQERRALSDQHLISDISDIGHFEWTSCFYFGYPFCVFQDITIGLLFGITESTVHTTVRRRLERLMRPSVRRLSNGARKTRLATITAERFAAMSRFPPAVFGAIDWLENPIHPPSRNPDSSLKIKKSKT